MISRAILLFMRRTLAVIGVASTFMAGCGGSAKPTARTGCKGASIASAPASLAKSDSGDPLPREATVAAVCAHFGRPSKITREPDGSVTWLYAGGSHVAAVLSFKRDRVVEGAWFDQPSDGTYSISQSEKVVSGGHTVGYPDEPGSAGAQAGAGQAVGLAPQGRLAEPAR